MYSTCAWSKRNKFFKLMNILIKSASASSQPTVGKREREIFSDCESFFRGYGFASTIFPPEPKKGKKEKRINNERGERALVISRTKSRYSSKSGVDMIAATVS